MTDDALRRHYQGGLARRTNPTPSVTLEQLEALAGGRLREAEALNLLDQVMADEGLRAEYEVLRAVHVAGRAAAARRRRLQVGLGVAAGLLLAVTGVLSLRGVGPTGVGLRGTDSAVELQEPEEDAPTTLPVTLIWHPVEGATAYRIELVTDEGVVALMRSTSDTVLVLDEGDALASGTYRWWVEARIPSGHARSPLRRLTLRGP